MKKSVFAFVFILFCSFTVSSQESDYSYTESYEIGTLAILEISSESRNIEVIAHEGNTVKVFYSIRRDGDLLKLNKEQIKKGIDYLWNTAIEYKKSTLKIDLKGMVTATALDGDIYLENVTGKLNSRTPDGSVINLSN